jgi:hypothetical protein
MSDLLPINHPAAKVAGFAAGAAALGVGLWKKFKS